MDTWNVDTTCNEYLGEHFSNGQVEILPVQSPLPTTQISAGHHIYQIVGKVTAICRIVESSLWLQKNRLGGGMILSPSVLALGSIGL